MTFGEKLKNARKEAGLSQEQLAEKLSVSRSAVAKWESDKGMPDIDNLKANTAIAALMSLLNKFYETGSVTREELRTFVLLLNPFAPHLTEEMWEAQEFGGRVTDQVWPQYDADKCKEDSVEIAVV